jgi:hypothetical protein
MKFYTNKISTGKSQNFGEFVQKLAASNVAFSKTANIANLGDKKAPPFGKKEEKKDDKEVDNANKAEGTEKESCNASAEKEVKVAKEECCKEKDGETHVKMQEMDPVGGTNTGKPEGEKKKASVAKKADNSEIPAENKGVTHEVDKCCGAPTSGDGSEGSKKSEGKGEAKAEEKKEASASRRMVRIANLDSKTKNEWKNYWKKLYPSEYVDAMFADK